MAFFWQTWSIKKAIWEYAPKGEKLLKMYHVNMLILAQRNKGFSVGREFSVKKHWNDERVRLLRNVYERQMYIFAQEPHTQEELNSLEVTSTQIQYWKEAYHFRGV